MFMIMQGQLGLWMSFNYKHTQQRALHKLAHERFKLWTASSEDPATLVGALLELAARSVEAGWP